VGAAPEVMGMKGILLRDWGNQSGVLPGMKRASKGCRAGQCLVVVLLGSAVAGWAVLAVVGKKSGPFWPQPESSSPAPSRAARVNGRPAKAVAPKIRCKSNMGPL